MNIQPKYPWRPSTEQPDEGKAIVVLTFSLDESSVNTDVDVHYRKGVWPDPFKEVGQRCRNFVWAYRTEFCLHELMRMAKHES